MEAVELTTPFRREDLAGLCVGDRVLISGPAYTARDAAHQRLAAMFAAGERPRLELAGSLIYYTGPTPAPEGKAMGSAGPTTSYRMDRFLPVMLEAGALATMGKGPRTRTAIEAMQRFGAVYFAAYGGLGALLARHVVESELVMFPDLGAEAVRRIVLDRFPAVTAVDARGRDIYERR